MMALTLLLVTTRGFEIILPLPSVSSALISKLMKRLMPELNKLTAKLAGSTPVAANAGKLIMLLPVVGATPSP